MTILRALARTMLASYFVVNGVKAWRHPEEFIEAVEPVAEKLLPAASAVLPGQVAVYLPADARELVRTTGLAQVVGGVALATGIGRRAGAGVLAASLLPGLLGSNPLQGPSTRREAALNELSGNVALLGGVLLSSMDTEGKPNLAWRARAQKEIFAKESARAKTTAQRQAKLLAKSTKRTARKARQAADGARKEIASVIS